MKCNPFHNGLHRLCLPLVSSGLAAGETDKNPLPAVNQERSRSAIVSSLILATAL